MIMKKSILLLLLMPLFLQAQTFKKNELDRIVKEAFAQQKVAGASVLIAQNGKIILNRGYGFAHLGFRVPATPQTKYFSPLGGNFIIGAAIMQQVEKGNLSLDDDITKYLPGFNVQGHKITIRHLLTSTSGVPDYHYLGDPFDGQDYQPKASDELIDLFANKPLIINPGTKYDHSISNSALLVAILEKVSKQSYEEYLKINFISPLSLDETEYLNGKKLIAQFAQGYFFENEFYPATSSLLKYDVSRRLISTTGDLYKLYEGLKQDIIVSKNSFMLITSREEAAKNNSGNFGYGIYLNKEEHFDANGYAGSLEGFSYSSYYYPEKDITIIILSNTGSQNARDMGRQIARKMLGLSPLPVKQTLNKLLADLPITIEEKMNLAGTYVVKRKLIGNSTSLTYNTYKRTIRVYTEIDQLMMQWFGELPEPLLKQADGSFAIRSQPGLGISFKSENNNTVLSITSPRSYIESGARIGNADVKTFHGAAFENLK